MDQPMMVTNKPIEDGAKSEQAPARKSVLSIWKNFGDNTTMHGLGRAIHSKRAWKRVIWSILVIAGACVASMNLYKTVVNYFNYPVTTTVELTSNPSMKFPAVTICNLNPARLNRLDPQIQRALNESLEKGDSPEKQEQVYKLKMNAVYLMDDVAKDNAYYNLSEMIVDCRFDLSECYLDADFVASNNFKYGKCFTFNALEPVRSVQRAGNRNGLVLELDIRQDQYMPFVSTTGIKVLVHPPSVVPFPEESGIIVGPGRATSIGIRKVSLSRQPPPWGECITPTKKDNDKINMFGKDYKYTAAVCEKTCYQRTVFEQCGCCDANYPCNEKALIKLTGIETENGYIPDCDGSAEKDRKCLKDTRRDYFSGFLPCMQDCRPSCTEESYLTTYATGEWPGQNFQKNLEAKSKRAVQANQKSQKDYPDSLSLEYISKNFLRLEVYYDNFVEELIITNPAYDWNTLLSDIGGQLGLWLGFSIMTAIELLELIYDIFSFICRRMTMSRKK